MSQEIVYCRKPLLGPMGGIVGTCDLNAGHDGSCSIDGSSEQDMVNILIKYRPDTDPTPPQWPHTQPNSIIQDWAAQLGLRHQGVLVSAVRGCDGQPRESAEKPLIRFYRACVLRAHCGDPRNATSYMVWPDYRVTMDEWARMFFDGGLDHYPMHWLTHFMFAAEILGYHYPQYPNTELNIRGFWYGVYSKVVKKLHLEPETAVQLDARLNASEEQFGKQQDV